MHRWFFANEREECIPKLETEDPNAQTGSKDHDTSEQIIYTDWPFCVKVRQRMLGNEYVAITGNCDILGNWDPKSVYIMQHCHDKNLIHCGCRKYEATIRIPRNIDIEYRYCIIGFDAVLDDKIIRFWEVQPKPRVIRTCHNMLKKCDQFGMVNQDEYGLKHRVDRGWATTETYLQFKVFNAPFIWLKQCPRLLFVFIQPMYQREPINCIEKPTEPVRLTTVSLLHTRSTAENILNTQFAFTEVSNLRYSNKLHYQPHSGARCGPDDLQLFHCSIGCPEETLYRLDLRTFAHKVAPDEPPYLYGYGFIKPEQLINSEGSIRIKITCASTHRPLIEMNIKYLIIRPFSGISCDLRISYARHWRLYHLALDIGHRGTGSTYRYKNDVHRENTLFGFKQALMYRADMIEFDVQLTKDAQVVVYHDQVLRFAQSCNAALDKLVSNYDVLVFPMEQMSRSKLLAMGAVKRGDLLVVPFEAFVYEDLKLVHALQFTASTGCDLNCEQLMQDQQPFPLLSQLFDIERTGLKEELGFNIEVKWPQQDTSRRWPDNGFKPGFDRNFYVNTILEVVFKYAGKRRILFSSFDADICIMLRYKQNLYPVVLLVQDPERPLQFLDQRVNELENAAYLASDMELFGLNLHTNVIMSQPLILGLLRDLRMQTITWGHPNNAISIREKLKRYGVIGITFDRIDQKNQEGDELQGNIFCIDSIAMRNFIRKLEEAEWETKCIKP